MTNPIPLEAQRQRAKKEVNELKAEVTKLKVEANLWRQRYEAGGGEKAIRAEQKAQARLISVLEELDQFKKANIELLK